MLITYRASVTVGLVGSSPPCWRSASLDQIYWVRLQVCACLSLDSSGAEMGSTPLVHFPAAGVAMAGR